MESKAALLGSGGPVSLLAYTSIAFYIKLMKGITARPVVKGLDIQREKVRYLSLLLISSISASTQIKRKKINLMTAGETMTLIIIATVCGISSTLIHIFPFLSVPMTRPMRLNINHLVHVFIGLVETAEMIQKQVGTITKTF